MSGNFTYVSRKKNRKNKYGPAPSPTPESLNERFEASYSQFVTSPVCKRCIDSFTKILSERNKLERILCLGLGSLSQGTSTRISEVQLALLLEIQILVNAPITAYDPVFTELDGEFLKGREIIVETVEGKDYDSTKARTLFYLPHCDRSTNEAVVSELLVTNSLDNAIIFGNDLRNYGNFVSDERFKEKAPGIFKIVRDEKLEYMSLAPKQREDYEDAFTDLCLMWPKKEVRAEKHTDHEEVL